jgi:hypothetical protein
MKQVLLGIAGGLFAGLATLGILFTGPLSPSNPKKLLSRRSRLHLEANRNRPPTETEVEVVEEPIRCSVSEFEDPKTSWVCRLRS